MLITISNLYPRPDRPQRGMFNAQLFAAFGELTRVRNICLVPEWRPWRWPGIDRWKDPSGALPETRYLPVFYLPFLGRDWNWLSYRRRLRTVGRPEEPCDAVYSAWLYPDGVAATGLALEWGVPSWIMVQGSDIYHLQSPRRHRVILDACARAEGIVCVAEPLAGALAAAGVDRRKIHVIPTGVDSRLFRYRDPDEAWKTLPKAGLPERWLSRREQRLKTVLFVGNLVAEKGPDVLLNAWRILQATAGQCPPALLLMIGSGPLRRALEGQARAGGAGDTVAFLGPRPHGEIALWMNAADVLCLPSRTEGTPNVAIEALASGLPLVASDVGGCRDLLQGEPAARVVPAGDPETLAEALAGLLRESVDRAQMVERHLGRWSWQTEAAKILELMGRK